MELKKQSAKGEIKSFHSVKESILTLNEKFSRETQTIQRSENRSIGDYTEEVKANKSVRRMPWHQEPMKDVTSCDKPRGAANKHYLRGFPNEETPMVKNHGT